MAALAEAGLERVEVRVGDGSLGVPERSPFDAIAVAAAAPGIPPAFSAQLSVGGRLAVPGLALGPGARARLEVAGRARRARRCRVGSCPSSAPRGSGVADPIGGRSDRAPDYPATAVDSSAAEPALARTRGRRCAGAATGSSSSSSASSASGYVVNLVVFALAFHALGLHYLAAVCRFLVAVTNNSLWNRLWTFRAQRGHVAY